jgi:hypothetical protein
MATPKPYLTRESNLNFYINTAPDIRAFAEAVATDVYRQLNSGKDHEKRGSTLDPGRKHVRLCRLPLPATVNKNSLYILKISQAKNASPGRSIRNEFGAMEILEAAARARYRPLPLACPRGLCANFMARIVPYKKRARDGKLITREEEEVEWLAMTYIPGSPFSTFMQSPLGDPFEWSYSDKRAFVRRFAKFQIECLRETRDFIGGCITDPSVNCMMGLAVAQGKRVSFAVTSLGRAKREGGGSHSFEVLMKTLRSTASFP